MSGYNFRLSGALYEAGSWYDQTKGIYRATLRISRDDGKSWTQMTLSDAASAAYCVVPHPANENIIYVGGDERNASGGTYPMMMKTTNGGVSWTRIATSITFYGGDRFRVVEIDKKNPNKLFAGTYSGLYLSTDAGTTWYASSKTVSPVSIFIDPANSENVYMGCDNGIYYSSNGGSTWTDISRNITSKIIEAVEYDSQNQVLYIGTKYGGIYRMLLNPTVGVENATLPSEFRLFQNYPNPFNAFTAISYQLPALSGVEGSALSCVELRVFDVLGKTVARFDEGIRQPGQYTIRWDASGLPSGVYMYQLDAGSFRQTRCMVLVK
jgi:photosystem II stability/assembly factor-like uncharacterized protein